MAASDFKLNKWYLDFVNEEGTALILYAAQLHWKGITLPYVACLSCAPGEKPVQKSAFRSVQLPEVRDKQIQWKDSGFKIEGVWQQQAAPLKALLFDSEEGSLHWTCHQPEAQVDLKVGDQNMKGRGYAEQLILTALPWKIPMKELRWGRVHANQGPLVWIELGGDHPRQWVWFEGQRCLNCRIENEALHCPDLGLNIALEPVSLLESGKTIGRITDALTHYIPGFKSAAALNFLMADSYKWLSKAFLNRENTEMTGTAIHEWVNFNPK